MKNSRQTVIAEIIRTQDIRKQEDLIEALKIKGLDVAQATISRDLRELGVIKQNDGKGGLKYVIIDKENTVDKLKYNSALASLIYSTESSGNIVVLKTASGMAGAVAVGIDSMNSREILGCVAGDDTIIIVTRGPDSSAEFVDFFRRICEKARNGSGESTEK
ncbi:MAG: arginine repressor [Clostridia bacterium]|nr:arginine repressor [Clostridia bacterium]